MVCYLFYVAFAIARNKKLIWKSACVFNLLSFFFVFPIMASCYSILLMMVNFAQVTIRVAFQMDMFGKYGTNFVKFKDLVKIELKSMVLKES